ncbi:hypothetical protein HOLleu_41245 [Holothuria leucospilota]|uniref:Uncharacterized protein n=1 Tax=Holothuria leucospilota TaxID=206669 RepID=A0A9Q1BAJ6_HOLLE|nr:hypothetical protein HOLleu_41245 [Holothuria leucospilota]
MNPGDQGDPRPMNDKGGAVQQKNRKQGDKSTLPKWFEDSMNMHEHQATYLGKIYEMREKLIKDEKRLLEHSLTRMDRQKILSSRPTLQGRPRAFTSPSLLDDVKGILISRRPDVKTHGKSRNRTSVDDLNNESALKGKRIFKDGKTATFNESSDSETTDRINEEVTEDEVFFKLTKAKRGRNSCDGAFQCKICHEEPRPYLAFDGKERKEFCTAGTERKAKNGTSRRDSRKNVTMTTKRNTTKDYVPEIPSGKRESFSKLPKLKDIPRRKRYETKNKNKSFTSRQKSSSQDCFMGDITGKQININEQCSKPEKDELFSKLESLETDFKGNSPTCLSPRSISPYSLSGASTSPTSPQELKFPENETFPPKVEINLPQVPLNTPKTHSPLLSISANNSELEGDHAPVIVLRPATPYVEKIEQPTKQTKKGWALWQAVRQTEIRRLELKKLIEDIKEFNTNNRSIEQRLSEVTTT